MRVGRVYLIFNLSLIALFFLVLKPSCVMLLQVGYYTRYIVFHSKLILNVMATVTYGSIITDIKGSIGGLTYQSNGSGKILRLRPKPTNRASDNQQKQRGNFNVCVAAWATTSLTQKNAWNALAAAHPTTTYYGATRLLNGFQMFNQLNSYRLLFSLVVSLPTPIYQTPIMPPLYTLIFNSSACIWVLQPAALFNDYYYVLYTSLPIGTSVAKNRTAMKLTKIVAPFTGASIDFKTEYLATHNLAAFPVNNGVNRYVHVYLAALTNNAMFPSAFNRFVVQI